MVSGLVIHQITTGTVVSGDKWCEVTWDAKWPTADTNPISININTEISIATYRIIYLILFLILYTPLFTTTLSILMTFSFDKETLLAIMDFYFLLGSVDEDKPEKLQHTRKQLSRLMTKNPFLLDESDRAASLLMKKADYINEYKRLQRYIHSLNKRKAAKLETSSRQKRRRLCWLFIIQQNQI